MKIMNDICGEENLFKIPHYLPPRITTNSDNKG